MDIQSNSKLNFRGRKLQTVFIAHIRHCVSGFGQITVWNSPSLNFNNFSRLNSEHTRIHNVNNPSERILLESWKLTNKQTNKQTNINQRIFSSNIKDPIYIDSEINKDSLIFR